VEFYLCSMQTALCYFLVMWGPYLTLFEKVSGMRINLSKSEFIPMHLDDEKTHEVAHILSCSRGTLPFKYLGVLLHVERLKREDIQPLVDKLIKRVAGWRGRLLAYSSRLTLIKSCLASVPVYLLSFIKFPKWAIRLLETQMTHCLWNNSEECHMYHLANWQHVAMEKDFGGLGVPNLRDLNICLLGSWVRRYAQDKDKLWRELIDFKYDTNNRNLFFCNANGVSNFWKGVLWAAHVVKMGYRWRLGNGRNVRFWEDVWVGTSSLAIQYWDLYCILNEQNRTVAKLWNGQNLKCTFC
jgi:hypothetical protein